MRYRKSVAGLVPRRAVIVGMLATIGALLVCGVAAADTVTTDFESFATGSVNGQQKWKSAPPGSIPSCSPLPTMGHYDQAVIANGGAIPGFGQQSLRMSNLCGSGEFFYQTYSTPVQSAAGEDQPNREYTAQFSFIPKTSDYQPGLFMSVSPDSYEGSRMSWVGLEDTPDGIKVSVSDTPGVDGDFVDYDVAALSRKVPHTIKFWIKLNPGPDNDLVRIYIDDRELGQCFTTWENYYRTAPEQAPPPNVNTPADLNSLQFRTSVQGPAALATTGGYLFDNVSVTTANGPGPPGCDTEIDKRADAPTVTAGSHAGYTITVRNRGRLSARDVRVCDHIPRRTTFISASRKLTRAGRERCLIIPRLAAGQSAGFHVVLGIDSNAPAGGLANIADVTPGVDRPGPPAARPDFPRLPAAPAAKLLAVRKARAIVRVLARRTHRIRPRFTG